MKEVYEKPQLEEIYFQDADVITASGVKEGTEEGEDMD